MAKIDDETNHAEANPELSPPWKGFAKVPTALYHVDVSPSAFKLYAVLWSWKFRYRSRKPSIEVLTSWCRMTKPQLLRARAELVDAKLLNLKTGGGYKVRTAYELLDPPSYCNETDPVGPGRDAVRRDDYCNETDPVGPELLLRNRPSTTVTKSTHVVRRREAKTPASRRVPDPLPSSSTARQAAAGKGSGRDRLASLGAGPLADARGAARGTPPSPPRRRGDEPKPRPKSMLPEPDFPKPAEVLELERRLGRELTLVERMKLAMYGQHDRADGDDPYDPDGMSENGMLHEVQQAHRDDPSRFTPYEASWVEGQTAYRKRGRREWTEKEKTMVKNTYAQRVWAERAKKLRSEKEAV